MQTLLNANKHRHKQRDIPTISYIQPQQCVGAPDVTRQSALCRDSHLTLIRPFVLLWARSPLTFYPWVRPLTGKWLLLYGRTSEVTDFHLPHDVFSGAQKVNSLPMHAEVNELFLTNWSYVRLQRLCHAPETWWLYIQHICTYSSCTLQQCSLCFSALVAAWLHFPSDV